jgi:hypothetical protein
MKLPLKLISGGVAVGEARVHYAPSGKAPVPVDAMVQEQDTALVMSPVLDVSDVEDEPAVRLYTALHDFELLSLGSIKTLRRQPLTLAAIVFDLDQTPMTSPGVVSHALDALLAVCGDAGSLRIAMPILGVRRGGLALHEFADVLGQRLGARPGFSADVWLLGRATDRHALPTEQASKDGELIPLQTTWLCEGLEAGIRAGTV